MTIHASEPWLLLLSLHDTFQVKSGQLLKPLSQMLNFFVVRAFQISLLIIFKYTGCSYGPKSPFHALEQRARSSLPSDFNVVAQSQPLPNTLKPDPASGKHCSRLCFQETNV